MKTTWMVGMAWLGMAVSGLGAELQAAKGTAWGLLSAVTEFVDHRRRARNRDNRLDSAWFGMGAAIKQKAQEEAMKMVA